MEQLKWTTPDKAERNLEHVSRLSPAVYNTPVKQSNMKSKYTGSRHKSSCLSVLPNHITPPSGLTKFMVRNPFETDLTNRLHLSVMSPTVFSKASSIVHNSPDFTWSIEELALMQPAKIEEFPTQQVHPVDPELETKAQAAIDQFFQENQIIPSPWQMKRKEANVNSKIDLANELAENLNMEAGLPKTKKDGSTNTALSLPPQLPPYLEEILKPYFIFKHEQSSESDDANSSNSSLRRKLFFNHEEPDNDTDSSMIMSPVKINGSLIISSSPPQSGMFIHGTPVNFSENAQQGGGVSVVTSDSLSPPNMSPIHSINMSYNSARSKSRSIAKLDFTADMSIENSVVQTKDCETDHLLDISLNKTKETLEKRLVEDSCQNRANTFITKSNLVSEMDCAKKSFTVPESDTKNGVKSFSKKQQNILHKLKHSSDCPKLNDNENFLFQQTNSSVGFAEQQSVSNSVQDTGYQTCSMSSTVNATDSCNGTPSKHKFNWGDRIARHEEDLGLLDWKESLMNVFSSTPSRSKRDKDNPIF